MTTASASSSSTARIANVPLLDITAQHAPLRPELDAAISRVMDSNAFILGGEAAQLETEIAAYSHCKHAVACASGSDALLLALMALDIKEGDEVITTPYTFFATASAITRLGARPVFVDIEWNTFNIDADLIQYEITPRTKAIMPVHLYGQCAEMDELLLYTSHYKIPIVEDAAQAIGAEDAGRRAGSMSAVGCFSFYPAKNLGACGDGGMMVTNDDRLAERLRVLRVHGETSRYHHKFIGINSRLDGIQAAILRVKLPHLDSWSDLRARNAARYFELFAEADLPDRVSLPHIRGNVRHIFNQFVIRVDEKERDALVEHLRASNIGTAIYYPVPLHLQECFAFLGYKAGDFPHSEQAARETLALPIYSEMTYDQQAYVVETIRRFFD
ncbi:MAG: DegT/DnrJ/EryC1/StrS family aminotransferase [Pyrinomonadaceae bacterium MAG19_C2-C3]|nr:DegT/DnrJ/EryC1/StrS family aminotransferase [Pyrinomonadaceae bacterium MAG19_C2-C3]